MNSNLKQAVPFFGVTNIDASVRFYVDGLGFEMTIDWRPEGQLRWCWLKRGDVAVMLQSFVTDGSHANVPAEKLGVGVSICFMRRRNRPLSRIEIAQDQRLPPI